MTERVSAPVVLSASPLPSPPRVEITSERRQDALRRLNRRGVPWRLMWDWARSFLIAVFLFLVVRAFFVEAFKIPTGSMEGTLLVGDFLLVNKLVYGAEVPLTNMRLPALQHPRRGEVIVFIYPVDPTKNFVKRLVGVPGDTLAMKDGVLYVNGAAQRETYATHTKPGDDPSLKEFDWQNGYVVKTAEGGYVNHPSSNNWGPLVVPEKNYFVLGDNRDNSMDSRYWGFVPDSLIRGRPIFVYYSYAPDTTAHSFAWLTHIRWRRIGERID
ncbi:MAG TPA: signal peptidase I [Gemmatimonadaceae bacterium]|nr:signal peptidase I [Gemmatimonadaceae bacterium]